MHGIHIVIVTYNGETWIQRCLQSIIDAAPDAIVHIIDNCSSDKTVAICEEMGFDVKSTMENLGFGRANNMGIEQSLNAGAEDILLLNQDAYLTKESINNFYSSPIDPCIPQVHAFLQMNGDGTDFDRNFKNTYLKENYCPGFLNDFKSQSLKESYDIKFANAAAWVIPKTLIEQIGGFNPSFFHYGEDDNYIHRVHFHGFKIILRPRCQVFHDRGPAELNPYHRDALIKERRFLLNISHPSRNDSAARIRFQQKRVYLQKRFKRIPKNKIIELIHLEFMQRNKVKDIIRNRERSQKKGYTFLDLP
ncbi:glycosyltransferase family 2 protein [bacterium]|nr:glycosyltransferase family 2 protein [bacterium]